MMIKTVSGLGPLARSRRLRTAAVAGAGALALLAMGLAGPAAAQDKRVRIINKTSHAAVAFYARPKGRGGWTPNIISGRRIASGAGLTVNFGTGGGGCVYDLRIVFDDKAEQGTKGIDVCKVGSVTYQ